MNDNKNIKRKNKPNIQTYKQHTETNKKQLHTDKIKNPSTKSVPVRIKVRKVQKDEINQSEPKAIDESKEIETEQESENSTFFYKMFKPFEQETETEDELLHTDELKNLSENNPSDSKETDEPKKVETEQKSEENKNQNSQYQTPIVKYQPQYQPNQQYPPHYESYQPYQQYQPQNQPNQQYYQNIGSSQMQREPGFGKSIACLILGIIAVAALVFACFTMNNPDRMFPNSPLLYNMVDKDTTTTKISIAAIISIACSIIGLVQAYNAYKDGYTGYMYKVGRIMAIVCLILTIWMIPAFISNISSL